MRSSWLKWLGRGGLLLVILQCSLVVLSWLLSAMRVPGVRSLLSGEGIRWFFSGFTQTVASPVLVWLLLLLIAFGTLWQSGVSEKAEGYRRRIAFRVSLTVVAVYVLIIALLVAVPHAILISATGSLFPSAFSRSLVAVVAFGIVLFSVAFGMMSGRFKSLADILAALSSGISYGAPVIVVYIFLIQLLASVRFVFG